jgi:signal transduction histidine kinase
MPLNFFSLFNCFVISILVFQCLLSLVQFLLNKQKEFFLYSIYTFLLTINFLANFYFWLRPPLSTAFTSYTQLFFGLPVNYFIYIAYCFFIKEYLKLSEASKLLDKKINVIILVNLALGVGSALGFYFFPVWWFWVKHALMVLSFLILIYPIYLLWIIRVDYNHFIIRGTAFVIVGILFNIILSMLGFNIVYSESMIIAGTFLEVVWFNYALQYKMKKYEQQLLRTEVDKQKAIKNEYRRVAADLHDEVGSTLSSIHIISVVSLKKMDSDVPESKRLLQLISNQAKKMQHNLSDIVWGLSTNLDSVDDLAIKLREILEHTFGAAGVAYNVHNIGEVSAIKLSVGQRRNIILIFKEAINNILKYAQAENITVSFEHLPNTLTMHIMDDGIGFDINATSKTSNGLNNMALRATQVQGHFQITSNANKGTTISVNIPLSPSTYNLQINGF